MAAGLSVNGRNKQLGGFGSAVTHVSLHSADPGTNGANELTGGSPAYARKSVTWAAPSAGTISSSNAQVFDVAAGSTVAFAGYWDASTSGNFYGSRAVTSEVFAGQGTYTVASGDIDEANTGT